MNIQALLNVGIKAGTLEALEHRIERAVVHEEFESRKPGQYRTRAVRRLIRMKVPFSSEANITFEMAKLLLRVVCPYCQKEMKVSGGSGSGDHWSTNFVCKCGADISVGTPHDGFRVTPKEAA